MTLALVVATRKAMAEMILKQGSIPNIYIFIRSTDELNQTAKYLVKQGGQKRMDTFVCQ